MDSRIVDATSIQDKGLPYHLIGTGENERESRSYLDDDRHVSVMVALQNYCVNLYRLIRQCRQRQGLENLTYLQSLHEYRGLRAYDGLWHKLAATHLSKGATGVKAVVSLGRTTSEGPGVESSLGRDGGATSPREPNYNPNWR